MASGFSYFLAGVFALVHVLDSWMYGYVQILVRTQFKFSFCCISAEEFDFSLDFGQLDVWL